MKSSLFLILFKPFLLQKFTFLYYLLGIWRLKISQNHMNSLRDDTLYGLESTLSELYVTDNHLTEIPSRALRNLQALKILDLSGNEIRNFDQNSWNDYGKHLHHLNLARNSISNILKNGFAGLPILESLDLSGNSISKLSPDIFNDGLGRISKVRI